MPNINYYQVLGIKRDATPEEIKAARKRQALALHSDKNPYGLEIMKLVNAAYSVLSDVLKRRVYDRDLASGTNTQSNEPHQPNEPHPDTVSELERELAEAKSKYSKIKKKFVSSKKDAENAQKELIKTQSLLSEREDELFKAQADNEDVRIELVKSRAELSEKESENKRLQNKQSLLQIEAEKTHHQIDLCQTKIDKLGRDLGEERRKSDKLEIQLEEEVDIVREEVNDMQVELVKLKSLLSNKEKECKRWQDEVESYQESEKRLDEELVESKSLLTKLSTEIEQLQFKKKLRVQNEVNFHQDKYAQLEKDTECKRRQIELYKEKLDKARRELGWERQRGDDLEQEVSKFKEQQAKTMQDNANRKKTEAEKRHLLGNQLRKFKKENVMLRKSVEETDLKKEAETAQLRTILGNQINLSLVLVLVLVLILVSLAVISVYYRD